MELGTGPGTTRSRTGTSSNTAAHARSGAVDTRSDQPDAGAATVRADVGNVRPLSSGRDADRRNDADSVGNKAMPDPTSGLLSAYDLSDEEKKAIRNQNLWSALAQTGMGLLAAGSPISEGQRAQLIAQ